VTFPFLVLLLDYWPLGRFAGSTTTMTSYRVAWSLCKEKLPLLAIVLASSVMTLYAQHEGKAVIATEQLPIGFRVGNALLAYVRYLGKAIVPEGLIAFYAYPPADELGWQGVA